MKSRGSLFFSFLVVALLMGAVYYPKVDNAQKEAILMHTLLGGLKQLHYQPQSIDDDFSKKVFDLYIDRLDGAHRFFLGSEVEALRQMQFQIDDDANSGTYEFFNKSVDSYKSAISRVEGMYEEILSKPFDFTVKEDIELDGDNRAYAETESELKDLWRKWLKYETLVRLSEKIDGQDTAEEKKTEEQMEKEAREAVQKRYADFFARVKKNKRADDLSIFLNSITNIYDPHTGYFKPQDKENFDIGMSGTLEGIGARLTEGGDFTKVASIVPGGPAWKQKELEVNDLIMKVAQDEEDPIDVTGMRVEDVVKYIRGKKGTKVNLHVKKVDGSIVIVPIVRDIVILDESYAKSLIIDEPNGAGKIGYIKLPRFYADFNRRGGRSCATDVAKELEKLKSHNVNGVVLDLRNNGGGSLRDVVKMSGLFIEEGPIVQVKARESDPDILEDVDPNVQYDGPLVVMVNSFSASASEILAAALQDYGRAVIVGSNSTFGKGTVQRFFDLDRAIRGNSEIKPLGEIKVTIQKFYRIDGGSNQLTGVIPDIILPDRYHYLKLGEKENEYAMKWSSIEPVDYQQSVASLDNMDKVKAASKTRVASDATFGLILESARKLKEQRDDSDYPLNLKEFQDWEKQLEEESKKYDDIDEKEVLSSVSNLPEDMTNIDIDESKKARNEEWVKGVKKDIYIKEVLSIMRDMIKMQN